MLDIQNYSIRNNEKSISVLVGERFGPIIDMDYYGKKFATTGQNKWNDILAELEKENKMHFQVYNEDIIDFLLASKIKDRVNIILLDKDNSIWKYTGDRALALKQEHNMTFCK